MSEMSDSRRRNIEMGHRFSEWSGLTGLQCNYCGAFHIDREWQEKARAKARADFETLHTGCTEYVENPVSLREQLAAAEARAIKAESEVAIVWNQFRFQDAAKAEAQATVARQAEQLAALRSSVGQLTRGIKVAMADLDGPLSSSDLYHVQQMLGVTLAAAEQPAAPRVGDGREGE